MKKILSLLIAFCCLISFTITTVASTSSEPRFLFVLQAKQGEIVKTASGAFKLILHKTDINHITAFTDRPFRIVKTITGEQLASYWGESNPKGEVKKSFGDVAPNAIIVLDSKVQPVQLTSMSIHGNTIVYALKEDDTPIHPIKGSHAAVFIDSIEAYPIQFNDVKPK